MRGLRRSFGDCLAGLDGLDLDIQSGEFVAMIGRSGSGKSTLLRALAGLDQDVSGSLAVSGPVAVAFQEPRLVPWKRLLANVALGLRILRRFTGGLRLRAGGGGACRSAWPPGPLTLSGGEAQRASLARALVRPPVVCCCLTSRSARWTR